MIGIIIPPGQIKKLAQKTAHHVAANGSQFQKMILERQIHNAQFAFLQKQSPYRAYYDHMVAQISRKMLQQAQILNNPQIIQAKIQQPKQIQQVQQVKIEEPKNQQSQFISRVFQEIKEPDPDRFTAQQPQKITQAQIAIIQHTAQYVAKIGRDFLIALSQRQKSNPQFQFLKKSSKNYDYFVKIYEAYQNLLNLSQKDIASLEQMKANRQAIFNKCQQVFEYHAEKQKQLKGKDQNKDQNKKQSNIDWNDYQIVETIVFEGMNKKNKNLTIKIDQENQLNQNPYSGKIMEEKIISAPKKKQILQQCHICRNNILASEMTKHLKTCLGQKKRSGPVQSSQKDEQEVDIRRNLQNLSTKRPDIFGGDGAKITRKQNEDESDKIIWDGQAPNMSRTTASIAMVNNQQKKINEQSKKN